MKSMVASYNVPTIRGDNLDILRELGLTEAKLQYSQRVDALVDPTGYQNKRTIQFGLMETAVQNAYDSALADLKKTGMPSNKAQELAILASVQTKNIQEEIMESLFPSGTSAIAQMSNAQGRLPGQLETGVTAPMVAEKKPRAPRKKAAPKIVVITAPAEPAAPKKKRATKKKN